MVDCEILLLSWRIAQPYRRGDGRVKPCARLVGHQAALHKRPHHEAHSLVDHQFRHDEKYRREPAINKRACAENFKITFVRPQESIAEIQFQLQPALLRLSAMLSQYFTRCSMRLRFSGQCD